MSSWSRATEIVFGLTLLLWGLGGAAAMLAMTATPAQITTFGTFYAPVGFVMLALGLFCVMFIEFGQGILRGRTEATSNTRPVVAFVMTVPFLMTAVALAGYTVVLVSATIAAGPVMRRETIALGGLFGIYAAIRIPIALGLVDGGELAHAVGINRGGPAEGESMQRYAARSIVGFLIGVLAMDALFVGVNALIAPSDTSLYPFVSGSTALAALLWIVGLFGFATVSAEWVRTHTLRMTVASAVALAALVPAAAVDARVPLYPIVAGIAGGGWSISVGGVGVSGPARMTPPPFGAPTPVPTTTPSLSPIPNGVQLSGSVRWGLSTVPFVTVFLTNNGIARFSMTDGNGRFQTLVAPGTVSATVDVRAMSMTTWFTSIENGAMEIAPSTTASYPPIQLVRRIEPRLPASGAVLNGATSFSWTPQWAAAEGDVMYELRVAAEGADPGTPPAFSARTSSTSMTVPALPAGRRYAWTVTAFVAAPSGRPSIQIGQSSSSPFTTK